MDVFEKDMLSCFDEITAASELAEVYLEERNRIALRANTSTSYEIMRAFSDLCDALIIRIYQIASDDWNGFSQADRKRAEESVAIAAVGGYGRREMCPYSDVDVAFLATSEEIDAIDILVKRAFRILMDVSELSGTKVGYSFRRISDVEGLELETQTALLDARLVCGSPTLFRDFELALRKAIVPAAFVVGHIESRKKLNISNGTPFVVEPNIKEGYGGLRDLHFSRWISQVTWGFNSSEVWDGLRAKGILLDNETEDICSAAEFLSRVRIQLHILAKRDLDTLTAARHEQVAALLGFNNVESFISTYYSHAFRLWRLSRKISEACLQDDLVIEPGVVARGGKLHILDKGLLKRDPTALIRLFSDAQAYSLTIDRETSDLIINSARGFKLTPEAASCFLDILSRAGAASALRSMAEMGVLQAIIPQFDELMCLIPGDSAHIFTVGEHSLRAVESLESLLAEPGEQFVDVISQIQHFDVLFIATLLHDIGKLDSKRDHSKTGAFRAVKIAERLGMDSEDCRKVEFLVRNHLRMSETARLRDLNQRKTIRDFINIVKDKQLLDMLYLMTIADYKALGTKNWSQVQIRFLSELYERAAAAMRSPANISTDIDRHRERVRRELKLANIPHDEVDEHCMSMPATYLLNTPPDILAAHIGYVRSVRDGVPVVAVTDDRVGEYTEITVVAKDRAGLLSDITGALSAMNINIHAAQIFTRRSYDEIAIDVLYVDFEGGQLSEMKKWQVESELSSVLLGEVSVDELFKRWNKKLIQEPVLSAHILENISDHHTVLEIRAKDYPGLLYYLTKKISESGYSIHSARVATWGHEARDTFYLTNNAGDLLTKDEIEQLIDSI